LLEYGLTPELSLELGEHGSRRDATQLAPTLEVVAGAVVDRVELTEQAHREVGFGMVGLGFLELSEHVGPAAREHDARPVACAGFVRLERVADDGALVPADQLFERRGALVGANAVADDARGGEAPHTPR